MEPTETSPLIPPEPSINGSKSPAAVSSGNGRLSVDDEARQGLADMPGPERQPNTHAIITVLLLGTIFPQASWSIRAAKSCLGTLKAVF
jgi:hypothetical protein